MKVGRVLQELHELETELADEFRKVGQRHAAEVEVFHACELLASQCEQHALRLHEVAGRDRTDLPEEDGDGLWESALAALRRKASAPTPRTTVVGLLLLTDLRRLYVAVEECNVTWVMLEQAAKAARDKDLLELARECHTETEVQVKWLTTQIKVRSPQVLVAG